MSKMIRAGKKSSVANVSKYRVLVAGILSPLLALVLNVIFIQTLLASSPGGKVIGKANLKAYFQQGLEAYPELQFRLDDVFLGVSSVVLFYTNQKGTHTAEFMELSAAGKVACVVANYSTSQK
jgi:hypothetical protein